MKEYEPKQFVKQVTFLKESSKKSISLSKSANTLNSSKTFVMKKAAIEIAEENVVDSPVAKKEGNQQEWPEDLGELEGQNDTEDAKDDMVLVSDDLAKITAFVSAKYVKGKPYMPWEIQSLTEKDIISKNKTKEERLFWLKHHY